MPLNRQFSSKLLKKQLEESQALKATPYSLQSLTALAFLSNTPRLLSLTMKRAGVRERKEGGRSVTVTLRCAVGTNTAS